MSCYKPVRIRNLLPQAPVRPIILCLRACLRHHGAAHTYEPSAGKPRRSSASHRNRLRGSNVVVSSSAYVEGALKKYLAREQDIGYVWDWGDARPGSYINPEGENTTLSRYGLDFNRMQQTNLDNNRMRSFRIVWALPGQIEAISTGEIPG